MSDSELPSSKLGTKAHWDEVYQREINTFKDIGEEGEVWFGETAVDSMVRWCCDHCEVETEPRILDVGCGNGHLLFALLEEDYPAKTMLGVDYSDASIQLSRDIAAAKQEEGLEGAEDISWQTVDILDPKQTEALGHFDLVLDKGTFDAICLAPKAEGEQSTLSSRYAPAIASLMKSGAAFCITSCNWTQAELIDKFTGGGTQLVFDSAVAQPTFTFGGQTGQTTCTVAFRKTGAAELATPLLVATVLGFEIVPWAVEEYLRADRGRHSVPSAYKA